MEYSLHMDVDCCDARAEREGKRRERKKVERHREGMEAGGRGGMVLEDNEMFWRE